jgi:putative PIN family toxin of toxin-antitoxin system
VSRRAVYDTMIFLQWAALPEGRHHATIRALYDGTIRLCMSQALVDEVRDVLSRPSVVARAPNITPDRLKNILAAMLERAEWIPDVPNAFAWPHHPDDDHIFNLAIATEWDQIDIASKAHRLLELMPPPIDLLARGGLKAGE